MFLPIRILIIEDCEDDVMLVLRELRRGGFEAEFLQVETAEDMANALNDEKWDIVLSDYTLPSFSAPAALKVLRESSICIPFIVISGNVGEEIAVQLMQYGSNDYINKNNLTRLCPAIQRELKEFKAKKHHQASEIFTEHLWEILNKSQNEIYFFDAETLRFKIVNQGALKNSGYTRKEMLDKHPYDLNTHITQKGFLKLIQPLVNNEVELVHFETTIQRKNGTSYPVDARLQYSRNGEHPIFYAILIDISDRVKASTEIETLARFPQENPLPVIRVDNELQVIYANPASQDIIDHWTDASSVQTPISWRPLITSCISNKTVNEIDEMIGDQIYHWLLSPSTDNTYVNCYARNITKERKAEQSMRQAGQVFDNSIEAIMMTDENALIIRVNPAFQAITGYREEDIIGRNPSFLQSGEHDELFFDEMRNELNTEGRWQGEIFNRRRTGEIYPAYMTISAVKDEDQKVTDYIAIFADISEKKKAQEDIHKLAYYDSLTNLPNRRHMQDKLHTLISNSAETPQDITLLYLDLDRFKTINESLGHVAADEALTVTANRLVKSIPDDAIVGRMDGDEFLIIISHEKIDQENHSLITAIKHAVSEPLKLKNQEVYLSITIGVSHFPNDASNMDNLIKYAETATKRAKVNGSGFELFTSKLEVYTAERITLESSLRKALARDEFLLHYQPQFNLKTGEITGIEALLRWQDPENGLISPADFIPLLEQTGLIKQVGDWVLHRACTQSMSWQAMGINVPRIAINLSAKQFSQKNLHHIISGIIEETGIDPRLVELEVTESTIMHQMEQVISILRDLHDKGLHISIDDFGTGYSSLSYLKHFPIDILKIDRSFVSEIPENKADTAIANTIIAMGHNLGLKVIAEGVETEEQGRCLAEMGCDCAQGYHYSHPLPADKCLDFLKKYTPKMNN